jgi:hypothetical protein
MVNIIANRHKAGVPRVVYNPNYDMQYKGGDFTDETWSKEMQKTSIFPVDTLHFPNGQWYWARIVSKDEDGTTHEGDLYVFDPGYHFPASDSGKLYGKWAEIHSYDENIIAFIGSHWNVPTSGYNAYELDYYEPGTIDNAVAWVNRRMLDLANEY